MGKIFAIMSGKGGVGKSTLAAALAEEYARQGLSVVLLDGDTGLRCADLMLGLQDRVMYDLGDVADKSCALEEALVSTADLPGLSLLAAPQMLKPSDLKAKDLGRIITRLAEAKDVLILDAPAGIGRGLKNLLGAAAEPVIVATMDDVSLRDAERLATLLSQREEPRPTLVFNRVSGRLVRRGEVPPPAQLAQSLDMPLVGILPESVRIYQALLRHQSALHCGDKAVEKEIHAISCRLLDQAVPLPAYTASPLLRLFNRGGERE